MSFLFDPHGCLFTMGFKAFPRLDSFLARNLLTFDATSVPLAFLIDLLIQARCGRPAE